ncbi:LacI family DNA-binding transcriptional regulator [Paraoerskovia marina]|uniref:LacI family DNA-binding transcriptional regulator n=1 Tax=Paraoerskovia marina TaxID=545619 RepID=UPI0004926BB5|nr:LacI family DNA-binding transcriptional regulator [Paraoerskovia marina]
MADVAKVAGVSHQTVSRVLNEHPSVRPETRDRVLAAIEKLGYRRNSAARALVTRRSGTIGIVTPDSALYGPTSTLIAIEQASREVGLFVSVATLSSYDAETMNHVLDHFLSQGVEGIVVIAPQVDVAAAVETFVSPVPVVLVADASAVGAGVVRTIGVDQYAGARLATEHLLELGHRRIVHVAGPTDWFDARARTEGWRDALGAAGVSPEGLLVQGDWSSACGYDVGRRLTEDLAGREATTAVFAGNDQLALGMLHAFWEQGVSVPGQISVVGFDDIEGSRYFAPSLTTVRQPFATLGRACLDLLMAGPALAEPAPVSVAAIAPELVVRESTARVG